MTIHTLSAWSPANAAERVLPNAPVSVKVSTANSDELELDYRLAAELENGTFVDTLIVDDTLELEQVNTTEDFEGDTVGTAPADLTLVTTNGTWTTQDPSGSNQVARCQNYNQPSVATWDSGPATAEADLLGRVMFSDSSGSTGTGGLCLRLTGSTSTLRGYCVVIGNNSSTVYLRRFTGDGSAYGITSAGLGFTVAEDAWYWIRYRIVGNTHYVRVWADGDTEPATWKITQSDSTHSGAGAAGLVYGSSVNSPKTYYDDLWGSELPSTYPTSGTWTGPDDSIAGAGRYSFARISWTETTPASTTVAVQTRIDSGTWTAATNGAEVPGLTYDSDLTGKTLGIRVTLATTDPDVTPVLEDLLVEFVPLEEGEVELLVDGISCKIANGNLEQFGDLEVDTGAVVTGYDRTFTSSGAYYHKRAAQSVTAELKYQGSSLGSISYTTTTLPDHREAALARFVFPVVSYDSVGARLDFRVYDTGRILSRRNLHFRVVDKGSALAADLDFYVASGREDDFPGEVIVADPAVSDTLGELIVRGYAVDDFPGELLVQGYRHDDTPGEVLAGIRSHFDFVGSAVAGVLRHDDHPGAVIVYGVNRANTLELVILSESTYQALTGRGYGFS